MSNMTQLFDASRFPGHVKVQSAGKAAVMTLCGPGNRKPAIVLPMGWCSSFFQPDLYPSMAFGTK